MGSGDSYASSSASKVLGEVLLVDGDATTREVYDQLLKSAGLIVTATGDVERAQDLVANRFFSVVVIDLDTPKRAAGLDFLVFCRNTSPVTAVLVLSARGGFETAASAFRAGAKDVVPKTQKFLDHLQSTAAAEAGTVQREVGLARLFKEVSTVHQGFLERLLKNHERYMVAEDRFLEKEGLLDLSQDTVILFVVDSDPEMGASLASSSERVEGPLGPKWRRSVGLRRYRTSEHLNHPGAVA